MEVYKSIAKVAKAMSQAGISKDNKNQSQGYKFRGIDDVYNSLAPALVEAELVILPRCVSRENVERQTAKGGAIFYTTLMVEFDFVSSVDGSKHTITTYGEAMDSADKSTNKAMSAAYKYACFQAFCIPTEGDNDADAHTHEVVPQRAKLNESDYDAFQKMDFSSFDELKKAFAALYQRATNKDEQARLQAIYTPKKSNF